MNRRAWQGRLLAAGLALATMACGTSPEADERAVTAGEARSVASGTGPCVVVGTVIEAATAEPVGGARVEGPGGFVATTDEDGRFELSGLALGAAGELVASLETEGGGRLQGLNRLRPLRAGRLEVVIFLRPADK